MICIRGEKNSEFQFEYLRELEDIFDHTSTSVTQSGSLGVKIS